MDNSDLVAPTKDGQQVASAPPKPPTGHPCNGCGYCCLNEACALSVSLLKSTAAPCIALEREDGRYYCGLVRRPAQYIFGEDVSPSKTGEISVLFASMLGLGAGCDA